MSMYRWISQDERRKIEKAYQSGEAIDAIAKSLGRNRTTIYNEIRRGDTGEMDENGRQGYSAEIAQRRSYELKQQRRTMATV